jgi:hypothetical protein
VIKSVARLPSEEKLSRRSHVVDLRHVKESYEHVVLVGKIQRPFLIRFPASPRESLVVTTRCL